MRVTFFNEARLVKRKDSLTRHHVTEINEQEDDAFRGIEISNEIPGYLGEVDISEDAKDPRSSSLDPDMFIFFPPFLKYEDVKARRFGENPSDRWYEWEDELEKPIIDREHPRHKGWEK